MDTLLRNLLRDADSSAEACFHQMRRAGYTEDENRAALLEAGKLSGKLGEFENLQVKAGIKSLDEARDEIANLAFDEYEFPHPVVANNGWEYCNDLIRRTVFLQPHYDEDGNEITETRDSISVVFSVYFFPDSAVTKDFEHF